MTRFNPGFQPHHTSQNDAVDHGAAVLPETPPGRDQRASFKISLIVGFTVLSPARCRAGSCLWSTICQRRHSSPLSARDLTDPLCAALRKRAFGASVSNAPAHHRDPASPKPASVVQVLYRNSVCRPRFAGKSKGRFCSRHRKPLTERHISLGFVVTPAGFEPATCPLGGGCSIQLSHGAVCVLLTG